LIAHIFNQGSAWHCHKAALLCIIFGDMKMEYFLFAIILLCIVWGFPRIGFIKRSGLSAKEIRLLVAFKIATGLIVAYYFEYVFKHISANVDYIGYNEKGFKQYQLLLSHPRLFFSDFSDDVQQYGFGDLFGTKESFWANIRFTLLYKGMALLNLVTHGNFYFNTVLFSSLVFFANVAFFRIYYSIYKAHKWLILFVCFCLPSLMLYTACIHKDGIIFLCLGLVSYIFYRYLSGIAYLKWYYLLLAVFSIISIFLFRNYVLVALLPAMLIGILCRSMRWKKRYIFAGCYPMFLTLFFLSGFSHSSFNLPAAVVQRKADFAGLVIANTNIPMNNLQPTFISFAKNLPQAINHFLFRPYLWEFSEVSVMLTAFELLFYQLLIVLFILYRKKDGRAPHPFNLFGLALLINMMLIIGYTIPNIGAIVRYRSIFWIYVVCPLLCTIDWRRLIYFRKTNTA